MFMARESRYVPATGQCAGCSSVCSRLPVDMARSAPWLPVDNKWFVLHLRQGGCFAIPLGTRTRAGLGFSAGVKDYRLTYFMDDYKLL